MTTTQTKETHHNRARAEAGTSRQPEANARLRLLAEIRDLCASLKVKPVYRRRVPTEVLELQLRLLKGGVKVADPRTLMTEAPEEPKPIPRMRPGTTGTVAPSTAEADTQLARQLKASLPPTPAQSGEYRAVRPEAREATDAVVQALAQVVARILKRELEALPAPALESLRKVG